MYIQAMSEFDLPPLNTVRVFEAAARLGSFKAAAAELFVTPSAVSHQIANLEQALGTVLFIRDRRGLTLTDDGEIYWRRVRDALSRLAQATADVRSGAAAPTLTVVAAPSLTIKWLMPRLEAFLRSRPDLRVRVEAAADRQRLGDADVGLFYGAPAEAGLHVRPLIREQLAVLCSPRLLAEGPTLTTPDDLVRHVLIHARNRVRWRDWLQDVGAGDLVVRQELSVERSTMAIDAAVRGVGVILESAFLAADEISSGQLVEPFGTAMRSAPEDAYFLAMRDDALPREPVQAFLDWLRVQAGTDE
jgi:LysR family glycine cleavage system transcriptional activator